MADIISEQRCTVEGANHKFCDSPAMPAAPFPICYRHAGQLLAFMRDIVTELSGDPMEAVLGIASLAGAPVDYPTWEQRQSCVYYVQVGETIKIGTSVNMQERLRTYPPYAKLLATEPGGFQLEAQRHRQFNAYLMSGREWFTTAPELLAHIETLGQQAAA